MHAYYIILKYLLYPPKNNRSCQCGFTLVETLVALAVLGMFFTAITLILQMVIENVGESRVRSVALALAQQKMEVIRNLPYNQVGSVGGIPQGPLLQSEIVQINSLDFTNTTSVIYIDDPFDGIAPYDLINSDYKRVRVEITWGGTYPSRQPVSLVTNLAPKGVETVTGGGTLFIQVFNANGVAIPNATIKIDNTSLTPAIHMQTLTNVDGLVVLPGSPACITCYQISVTKTNYSTDRTYSTQDVANPLQPHATIIDGQITQVSFAIDQVSSIIVNSYGSRESGYPPISNVLFTVKGSKIIGFNTNDEPVYKYTYSTNTGGGTVSLSGLEWDTYSFDLSNSAHDLAGSNPFLPLALIPATNTTLSIVAVPKTNTSLLIAVKNINGTLQASASSELENLSLNYAATKSAGASGSADMGQSFFGGLIPETYLLRVTSSGYQEATASLTLTNAFQEIVTLNPVP